MTLALASPAAANTYLPNKLGDHAPNGCTPADCTLREAITKANGHQGADVVVVRGGKTYTLALLNSAGNEDLNATGDLDVRGSLTIRSSNKQLATVDANAIDRVFETGPSGAVSATLSRLLIRRGSAGYDIGGGVLADAGTLRIARSRVSTNFADSPGGGVASTTTPATRSRSETRSSP